MLTRRTIKAYPRGSTMRVFISSVRTGLEDERDALPGLIKAIGHEPVRFEDFGARAEPSRDACTRGVESSDVYLLLLGPNYGHVFPETGQSATEDEWHTAKRRGLKVYVFHKSGVAPEARQEQFISEVGDYAQGRFWDSFASVADLLTSVAVAVRDAEQAPTALQYEPAHLEQELAPFSSNRGTALLEIHVLPTEVTSVTERKFQEALDHIPSRARADGLVGQLDGLDLQTSGDVGTLRSTTVATRSRWGEVSPSHFEAAQITRSGHVGVAYRLPADNMGAFLDHADAVACTSAALQFVAGLRYLTSPRCVVTAMIGDAQVVTVGTPAPRNSMSMRMFNKPAQTPVDESVPVSALSSSSLEIAEDVIRALTRALEAPGF